MKLSQEELLQIISDVTTMLGDILAQHIELNENLAGETALAREKADELRAKLADQKLKIQKLRDTQQRRRELEKIRRDHERESAKATQTEGKST